MCLNTSASLQDSQRVKNTFLFLTLFQCQPGDFSSSLFIFRATHEAPSLFLKGLCYIHLFSLYLCGYLWRPEDKLVGVGSLLPSCGFWGWNLGFQAWRHMPFLTEAHWPRLLLLAVGVIRFYKKLQTQNI